MSIAKIPTFSTTVEIGEDIYSIYIYDIGNVQPIIENLHKSFIEYLLEYYFFLHTIENYKKKIKTLFKGLRLPIIGFNVFLWIINPQEIICENLNNIEIKCNPREKYVKEFTREGKFYVIRVGNLYEIEAKNVYKKELDIEIYQQNSYLG